MKVLCLALLALACVQARADSFDDKQREATRRHQQEENARYMAERAAELNRSNGQLLGKVPPGATITKCLTHHAAYNPYHYITNWNGIPLEMQQDERLDPAWGPPHLRICHYHDQRTGLDCELYAVGPPTARGYSSITKTCL